MPEIKEDAGFEKDTVSKIIDLCREVKDKEVRQIVLGVDYLFDYESELEILADNLRNAVIYRERMLNRIVNLAFTYIVSKYISLKLQASSNCEMRIQHAIQHLYSTYNVTDDVVRFVILNLALGLDANKSFREKFDTISKTTDYYKNTNEYINIFKHIQKLRQSTFKTKARITGSNEYLYKLFKKLSFICDLEIVFQNEYVDAESKVVPCSFKMGDEIFTSRYILAKYSPNEYMDKFLFLRSIDDVVFKDSNSVLMLNYTEMGENDTSEITKVGVSSKIYPNFNRALSISTPSTGLFYSFITGDLLRKRHRMSFCNGLASYKYYGELAASVMDALEMLVVAKDKQNAVIENFIYPVVKNNFNICKEDCICTGVGCKYDKESRLCSKDKVIELKNNLSPDCLKNMDVLSILMILFSVVGCKDILPQIFSMFKFNSAQAYDELFSKVNEQLDKRFSEFASKEVENLRQKFFKTSIDYLSLDLDESKRTDPLVAQTLKPFKIKAYTDALVASLENLDRDNTENSSYGPSENVYSIQSKIDLIKGISSIVDVRSELRDTLKIILAYYAGLANCTQQQLNYEIKAEQMSLLNDRTVKECRKVIDEAFMEGVDLKLKAIGKNPDFYTLFKNLIDDNVERKSEIAIMLGREIVNVNRMKRFISLDEKNKKCYLIERRRKENGVEEIIFECDLDDESQCKADKQKFVSRIKELLDFFKGEETGGARFACYPQVLTHTSSRVNVDNTTINAFTVYESEQYIPQKEYNVITYFTYEISKRYFYVAPKKFEKTRWITYPILIRCSEFYGKVIKEHSDE